MPKKLNRFELTVKYIEDNRYTVAVELGVEAGRFSRYILGNSSIELYYMIDLWTQNPSPEEPINILNYQESYDRTIKNALMPHPHRSHILKYDTVAASKFFAEKSVDCVFIDANQTFDGMLQNFIHWFPKVDNGGLITMRNYKHKYNYAGANKPIDYISKKYNIPFELTYERYPTAFFVKDW